MTLAGGVARVGSFASPSSMVGPQAIPAAATAAGPNYGLFGCQVPTLQPPTCYDPYQIRHAYNIDTLINAGFDGAGKTIVIVDAFQNPNIVAELNTFISFYGLPSLNGLGGPSNPSLGTFTQVAPDGLTPFDPTNGDMTRGRWRSRWTYCGLMLSPPVLTSCWSWQNRMLMPTF